MDYVDALLPDETTNTWELSQLERKEIATADLVEVSFTESQYFDMFQEIDCGWGTRDHRHVVLLRENSRIMMSHK